MARRRISAYDQVARRLKKFEKGFFGLMWTMFMALVAGLGLLIIQSIQAISGKVSHSESGKHGSEFSDIQGFDQSGSASLSPRFRKTRIFFGLCLILSGLCCLTPFLAGMTEEIQQVGAGAIVAYMAVSILLGVLLLISARKQPPEE